VTNRVRTRFAPSPTGDLHLGGAWTALASWVLARAHGGRVVLRVEDLDPPRVVEGSATRVAEDLNWLGLDWDEGPDVGGPFAPYTQSERSGRYAAAIEALDARGLVYPCDCSRKDIARAASAPHAGEELRYPGTCRDAPRGRTMKREPALRLRVPDDGHVSFDDGARGRVEQDVGREVGDFVLRRADGVYAYQLAVALDDARMHITHVVRAVDLLTSTPRQLLLLRLLGLDAPSYVHVPLVRDAMGERLAKRAPRETVRALRDAGVTAAQILGRLAQGLGLRDVTDPATASEIARGVEGRDVSWATRDWRAPTAWG
jgi:glutamyl-tRNA synthetase